VFIFFPEENNNNKKKKIQKQERDNNGHAVWGGHEKKRRVIDGFEKKKLKANYITPTLVLLDHALASVMSSSHSLFFFGFATFFPAKIKKPVDNSWKPFCPGVIFSSAHLSKHSTAANK
jgi:hypothetical protein